MVFIKPHKIKIVKKLIQKDQEINKKNLTKINNHTLDEI